MSNPPISKIDFTSGNAVLYTADGVHYTFPLVAPGTAAPPSPASTGGSTSSGSTSTGPLTMGNITDGSPVTLGTGPDTISLTLANNPGQPGNCSVSVMLDMADGSIVVIAAPLTVSSSAGEGGGQLFTLRGTWGALGSKVKDVRISPANPPGMAGLWMNAVSYNFQPLAPVQGQAFDSRGGTTDGFTPNLFNSRGIAITYAAQPAAAPATGGGTGTGTTGANNLSGLLSRASAGLTITLPTGTVTGVSGISAPAIIQGAPDGSTVLDAAGNRPFQGKGILVPLVSGATIQNLTIQNAQLSAAEGGNGAGIRNGDLGIGFTGRKLRIKGCQNGMLTFAADILIEDSDLSGNGSGDGYTHNMYFGSGNGTITLNRLTSAGCNGGHALKCRTSILRVSGGTYTAGGDASAIDLPEGGDHQLDGLTVVMPGGVRNTVVLGYGMENGNATSAGKRLLLSNLVIDNQTGGAVHIMGPGGVWSDSVLVLQGVKAKGVIPDISGFGSVQGSISAA